MENNINIQRPAIAKLSSWRRLSPNGRWSLKSPNLNLRIWRYPKIPPKKYLRYPQKYPKDAPMLICTQVAVVGDLVTISGTQVLLRLPHVQNKAPLCTSQNILNCFTCLKWHCCSRRSKLLGTTHRRTQVDLSQSATHCPQVKSPELFK